MKPLRVLITNWTMAGRHGSVLYVADLARKLFQRGHQPVIYAPQDGEAGSELRLLTIAVTTGLANITAEPDLIIGNSHPDLMAAVLHFPGIPAIYICHAWEVWLADAPRFPRILRYIAVDETCRDWLQSQKGIPGDLIRVIHNGVDLERFQQRAPLPQKPARAVVFSNYTNEANGLPLIREACSREGVALDVIGKFSGTVTATPEAVLPTYDLVFGKARCALEAMATGCAVIACDYGRLGGLVTAENWQDLRGLNFGRRAIRNPLTVDALVAEIRRYDAADAREVSRITRDNAGLDRMADTLLVLCADVLREPVPADPAAELRAASAYIATMQRYHEVHPLVVRMEQEATAAALAREQLAHESAAHAQTREQLAQQISATAQTREELARLAAAHADVAGQLRAVQKLFENPFVRLLRNLPGARALARLLAR